MTDLKIVEAFGNFLSWGETIPTLVEPGWALAVAAYNRPELRVLFYRSGQRRFWHTCTVPPAPDVLFESWGTIQCAPSLQQKITVEVDDEDNCPVVTVSPSIVCKRCGIHGFWTANEWRDV